MRMMTGWMIW
jgi:hypothetical protein